MRTPINVPASWHGERMSSLQRRQVFVRGEENRQAVASGLGWAQSIVEDQEVTCAIKNATCQLSKWRRFRVPIIDESGDPQMMGIILPSLLRDDELEGIAENMTENPNINQSCSCGQLTPKLDAWVLWGQFGIRSYWTRDTSLTGDGEIWAQRRNGQYM